MLSEWQIPRMDGEELVQALQAPNLMVGTVLMIGYPPGEGSRELVAGGLVEWLDKPSSPANLAEAVRVVHWGRAKPRPCAHRPLGFL